MAKASDVIRKAMGGAMKLTSIAGHIAGLGNILSLVKGDIPANATDSVKGIQGVFGLGDERRWQLLMIQIGPEKRKLIEDFLHWHFQGRTARFEGMAAWVALNHFRSFVTQMGSNVPSPLDPDKFKIVKKTRRRTKTQVQDTTETLPIQQSATNNSIAFLNWMAETIQSEPAQDADPKYLRGYEKLLHAFKVGGVPHTPEGPLHIAQQVVRRFQAVLPSAEQHRAVSRKLRRMANERDRRPRGFWRTLFRF